MGLLDNCQTANTEALAQEIRAPVVAIRYRPVQDSPSMTFLGGTMDFLDEAAGVLYTEQAGRIGTAMICPASAAVHHHC